jgi:site-specific recombinase XerD
MAGYWREPRDVMGLSVLQLGSVVPRGNGWWSVTDVDGQAVAAVDTFVDELAACGCSTSTSRSYCHDLLRWFRFLEALNVRWPSATREDVRDFVRWLQIKPNPQRTRNPAGESRPAPGSINPLTGKRYLPPGYAPRTINHALAVLSSFYDFTLYADLGPLQNPVPRPNEGRPMHRSQLEVSRPRRRTAYRQKEPAYQPRAITEEVLQQLFGVLKHDRDRALVAVTLSTGARAGELLSMTLGGVDLGRSVLSVVAKGRAGQRVWVPAAPEAFVWISRYLTSREPGPPESALWMTLRRPTRPLTYFGLRQVLERANAELNLNLTWHDFRHTFSERLLRDDQLSLIEVQELMRHRNLNTLAPYATSRLEELVSRLHQHLSRPPTPPPVAAVGYDTEDLQVLFPGLAL